MTASIPSVPLNFLGLPRELSRIDRAAAVVVPLPYDATTTYRPGTRDGPAAILAASQAVEWFDPDLGFEPCQRGISTLDPPEPDARGPEQMLERVRQLCLEPMRAGQFVVALGGEHSLSVGCVRALLETRDEADRPPSVLQIDAHADLRDSYHQTPYSHACVMRRLGELCPLVQVGLRSWSQEEQDFMEQCDLRPWTMDRIRSTTGWIDQVVAELGERVYLTIDLDGLDPAVCPGVGTPEPGGLTWHQLCDLLTALFARRRVLAADVVECLPVPGQVVSEFLAARLAYRLIGLHCQSNP